MKKILLLFLIPLLASCGVENSNPEVKNLLNQSDSLYKKALTSKEPDKTEFFYRAALMMEQAAEKGNLKNGYLDYNTGNAWLNAGETGKAILYFRKALKKLPGNSLVRNNLQRARESLEFTVTPRKINPLFKTLLFFHFDLSLTAKYIILIILLFLLAATLSLLLYWKKSLYKNGSIILAIISLLFIASIVFEKVAPPEGVVIERTTGRKGDSTGYDSSFKSDLPPGIEFKVLEKRTSWLYIELLDGRTCWIPEKTAEMIN